MPLAIMKDAEPQKCVLERIIEDGSDGYDGTLIGLHDEYSTHTEILPLLRLLASGRRVIAPRSARWSGYTGGGRFSWFSKVLSSRIEPIGFGDALMQLEQLAFEFADAPRARRSVILGVGQGATMALALGAVWPEFFSEIVAVDAEWPDVPAWELPKRDMSGIRALLVPSNDIARTRLAERGAQVNDIGSRHSGSSITPNIIEAIRNWMDAGTGEMLQEPK